MSTVACPEVSQEFSLERLERLYRLDRGHVWWRHDVDYVLECAIEMAIFEQGHGIKSTYHLMATGTLDILEVGREIQSRGHLLGAHVDLKLPRAAGVTTREMVKACREQVGQLEDLGLDVGHRVSFHAPPHAALWRDIRGFQHAMSPAWRHRYAADSRGVLRVNLETFIASHPSVQINLHPEWWFLPEPEATAMRAVEADKP